MSTARKPSTADLRLAKTLPPGAWAPMFRLARRATRPLERFLGVEAASGILLLVATAVAMALANSTWSAQYLALWEAPIGLRVGELAVERSLGWIVNDILMVIFFFVVGMEIRREIHHGELSELKRAALPIAAAIGGMLAPAGLYLAYTATDAGNASAAHSGWGVPMATDIAFAVGILTLLGNRVPAALRVLLLALAVIDDLGAILVIAIFYSSGLAWGGLGVAAIGFAGVLAMRAAGVRQKLLYIVPGAVLWWGIYAAGIHPTVAGVLLGLVTPVTAWVGEDEIGTKVQESLDKLREPGPIGDPLHMLDLARREAISPSESLIETLHPWVAYFIMPVFALANAGVSLKGASLDGAPTTVAVGVFIGLLVGKPLGIVLISVIAVKLGLAAMPRGLTLRHLLVLGVVAGIGFTMALFIAQLAFSDATLLMGGKIGVLCASGAAGVLSLVLGRALLRVEGVAGAAATADEAEQSTEA